MFYMYIYVYISTWLGYNLVVCYEQISALVLPPLESEVIVTDKRARSANTRLLIDDEKRLDKELWKGWQENHAATTKTPVRF